MIAQLVHFLRSLTDPDQLIQLLSTVLTGWLGYAALFLIVFAESGLLIGFFLYVNNFYIPLRQLAAVWTAYQQALAALDRISAVALSLIFGSPTALASLRKTMLDEHAAAGATQPASGRAAAGVAVHHQEWWHHQLELRLRRAVHRVAH